MNNNKHPEEYLLLAFFDDELQAAEAVQIQKHCDSCAECRQTLADFEKVQGMIQASTPSREPEDVWSVVSQNVKTNQRKKLTPSLIFGTAAACAAGIALGMLMGAPQGGNVDYQKSEAWATADYLWSGTDSPSLFVVFSEEKNIERSGES